MSWPRCLTSAPSCRSTRPDRQPANRASAALDGDGGGQVAVVAAGPWAGGDLGDGQARSGEHVVAAELARLDEEVGPGEPLTSGTPVSYGEDVSFGRHDASGADIGRELFRLVAKARAAGRDPEMELRATARRYLDLAARWEQATRGA